MEHASQPTVVDYDEYLRIEERSPLRHELVGGMFHAMVGASRRHNQIIHRVRRHVEAAIGYQPCEVFTESVKLRIDRGTIYYPDLLVTCDPTDVDPLFVDRPCLIVEVHSPGTESIDRREKLLVYRGISTLRAYMVIHQDEQRIEHLWRESADTSWQTTLVTEGLLHLPCPTMTLSLTDIYDHL